MGDAAQKIVLPGEVAPNPGAELIHGGTQIRSRRFYVGEKGKDPVRDWNTIQRGASHETKAEDLEFAMAKEIGEYLCSKYRDREWGVNVDVRNQMIVIGQPSLNRFMGYHIRIRPGETMPALLHRCYMAAGEILERFNVSRARKTDPAEIEVGIARDRLDNAISKDAKHEPVNTGVHGV